MKSIEQIQSAWVERKNTLAPVMAAGATLKRIYNGDHELVLPELEKSERAAVANLIQVGLDQHAMRIASVMPNTLCPPVRSGATALKRADDRRKTLQVWHYENRLPMKQRRRARHLIGYATSPAMVRPHMSGIPRWEIRDPLATFPAPCDADDLVPPDCIFAFRRSLKWLIDNHGDKLRYFQTGSDASPNRMYDCLEYIDAEQHSLVALGQDDHGATTDPCLLFTVDNRAGRPLVVVPGRITLDRLQGQFDQMVGMYETQALLWALQIHATKLGIFGETWLEGNGGETPHIINPADAYTGDVGVVEGGQLKQFRVDPGFQTLPAIDRLERAERIAGAVPAEMGGEGATNVRTARRGGQVLSATVDFFVQEHQELLAASQEEENRAAIAVAKAYWPNTSRTFYMASGRGQVTYTPSVTFETDANRVTYAYAGTDTNGLVIESGQRIGMGTLSKQSFMEVDPLVADVDLEKDRMLIEAIEQASVSALQTMAADPMSPFQPADWARLSELVIEDNVPLYKAIQTVQEEAQARQAQAQQGQLPPEAMQPGLAAPGAPGTAEAGAAIPPPPPSSQHLNSLLMSLRGPQLQIPSERA